LTIYGASANYWLYTPQMTLLIAESLLKYIAKEPQKALIVFRNISESGNLNVPLNQFLAYSLQFYSLYNSTSSFTFDQLSEYYQQYIEKFFLFDYYYRKIVIAYQGFKQTELGNIENYEDFFVLLEKDYQDILIKLNNEWSEIAREEEFEIYPTNVPMQVDFYKKEISTIEAKKVVIISDALRYEAAYELKNKVTAEYDFYTELNFRVSQVPSRTDFGMAALLPHKNIEFDLKQFKIEGISTSSIDNRRKILQLFNSDSDAIKYSDLEKLPEREARELFKKNLVYVYHDSIDASGDDRKTEHSTFSAVERAIQELSYIIKRIHSTMGVSYIFVTADHGFIYQNNTLQENMFTPIPETVNSEDVHTRHILQKKGISEAGISTFSLSKTSIIESELNVSVPKGINRFRKQGSGYQFIHGGMALQEIIVPVLLSRKGQKTAEQKVTALLVTKTAKIVSNALKVLLQQVNPVSDKLSSIKLVCGLYNTLNQLVSNEQEVLLNFSSPLPTERTTNFVLHLGGNAGNNSFYYLKVYDKEDLNKLNPVIEHRFDNSSVSEIDDFS